MKLRIADLQCDQLELSSQAQPPTLLKFSNISDGTGDLEFREGLSLLHEIAIRKLLAHLEIPMGGGVLHTELPATIEHVTCSGRIRNGFVGELRCSIVDSQRVSLQLESARAVGHLVAEGLHLKIDGRGGLVEVATLTLSDAQCTLGSLCVRLGSLTIVGLRVRWEDATRLRIEAMKASARGLRIERAGVSVHIESIDLSEGLDISDHVEIENIAVAAVEISVRQWQRDDETSETGEGGEAGEGAKDHGGGGVVAASRPLPKIELDRGIFDTVNGHLRVDATLAVTLPVIGRRVAIHRFRIPVDGGIINYRDFEKGLSDLEDAFIDIRVRGDSLVLERDIPLIPGLDKPIVIWPLESGELELAKQHLVRIGTLLNYQLAGNAEGGAERSKKSRVRLHRLDLDNIGVSLFLDETAVLRSGDGGLRAHADELRVTGSIHFSPDPEEPAQPTMLACSGKGLGTVAEGLLIAGHRLAAGLTIGIVESCELHLDELKPTSLAAVLRNISIKNVDFDLG